ncbi:cadherin-like domain-containing protein [Salinispirillum sp. LH 10-3-1]|uniref:Cadherin-like domain-containing protein n=1 Tax=Salinispirillum sp. LH 10-3-1 TaxID=2952525 RepID=A0AB38YJQ7_9GAMM
MANTLRVITLILAALLALAGCTPASDNLEASGDGATGALVLTESPRNFSLTDPDENLGLSGAFLYVDADENNATTNNWRFRIQAASESLLIAQLYLDILDADELSVGTFSLCANSCGANLVTGWVSGLDPRTLNLPEGEAFTVNLVVKNTEDQAQVVATVDLTWEPLTIELSASSFSGSTLTVGWEELAGIQHYRLYVVAGHYPDRQSAQSASADRWFFTVSDGLEAVVDLSTSEFTFWVTGLNSSGEVAHSSVSQIGLPAPELTINPIVVNAQGYLSLTVNGTTNLQADDIESLTVRLFPDTVNEISGAFMVITSDFAWAASLLEWPLPSDDFYEDALEVTLVTIYGVTLVEFQDIWVDTTPPSVTLDTTWVSDTSSFIEGSVSKLSTIELTLTEVDGPGAHMLSDMLNGSWSFDVTPLDLALGDWNAQVMATDAVGNSTSEDGTITVYGSPLPVDNSYSWLWDGFSDIEIPAAQGVLANDTDPQGLALTVSGHVITQGSGTLSLNSDGSFAYSPASTDNMVMVTYTVNNGFATADATLSIDIRRINDESAQACLFVPSQVVADRSTAWSVVPASLTANGAQLSVTNSGGLSLLLSDNIATINNPSAANYTGIEFEVNYGDGRVEPFGPYNITAKPAFNATAAVPEFSIANTENIDLVVPDSRGGILAFGPATTPAQADIAELYIARLDAFGVSDSSFGNDGIALIPFGNSSLSGRTVTRAEPRVQVVQPIGNDWLVGGYVEFEDEAQSITWLAAFMFRMTPDGSLSHRFNTEVSTDVFVPWLNESTGDDKEIGAITVKNPNEVLVARNRVTREVDGDVVRLRPASFSITQTTTDTVPDFDNPLFSGSNQRVRIMAPVPGGTQIMVVSQEFSTAADQLAIVRYSTESSWQVDNDLAPSGKIIPLSGSSGDPLTPISHYPNIEHHVITEAGLLWFSGMADTEGTNRKKYHVGIDLNRNENNSPAGFYGVNAPTAATEHRAMGLLHGRNNEVYELYSRNTSVYFRRFLEDGSLDPDFGGPSNTEKTITGFPNTQALLASVRSVGNPVGKRFLALHNHPSEAGARRPQVVYPYAIDEFPALNNGCIQERYNDSTDSFRSFAGAVWKDNSLYVGFTEGGWHIAQLEAGERWVRGKGRGSLFSEISVLGGDAIDAILPDSFGGVIVAGYSDGDYVIKRITQQGELDASFGTKTISGNSWWLRSIDDGNGFVIAGFSSDLVLDRYALSPAGNGEVSATSMDWAISTDEFSSYVMGLEVDSNDNIYVLLEASNDVLLKFNNTGTLDSTFGTAGKVVLPSSANSDLFVKAMSLVTLNGQEHLYIYSNGIDIDDGHEVVISKIALTGADPGALDLSFGISGSVVLEGYSYASEDYSRDNRWIESNEDNALFVALSVMPAYDPQNPFAEPVAVAVAQLDSDGNLVPSWGNQGIAPMSDRAQGANSILSMVFQGGSLYTVWESSQSFGVTALLPNGFVDTTKTNAGTTVFGGVFGDEATSIAVTPSGQMYLAADWLSYIESPVRSAVLWGLDYNGNAITGFGCVENCAPRDFGTAAMQNVLAQRLIPTERNQLLLFVNGDNIIGNDNNRVEMGQFFLEDVNGLNAGNDAPNSISEFSVLLNASSGDTSEIHSVSPFVNDRLLVSVTKHGGFGPEHFIIGFNREGDVVPLPYEGAQAANYWPLNPGNFANGQPQFPVYSLEDGQGDIWVAMQQTSPDVFWWVGKYEQFETDSPNWTIAPASNNHVHAVQLATDATGHVFVLDERVDNKSARIVRLDSDGDLTTNWGEDQAGYWGWVSSDVYEPSVMRIAPDGGVFIGGHTDGSSPILVRLNASGIETHRWTGNQLTHADAARVADVAIDEYGHATVLLDSFANGGWRPQFVRIPMVY